jgi:hypothetical protein
MLDGRLRRARKERYMTDYKGKYIEICFTNKSNWELFDKIASIIESYFSGEFTNKTDGLDQRFWDFNIQENMFTLHLEHYLGISIFTNKSINNQKTERIIKAIYKQATKIGII